MLATAMVAAAPASAAAATKSVGVGLPPKQAKEFQEEYLSDANAFFPSTITIHAGDSVSFVPQGFHNVMLPKKGEKPIEALVPSGTAISGATDAAGAAFWFNGLPALGFNPELLASGWGKSFTYNGKKTVQSGLPVQDKPKPMVVKFTKPGTYTYHCDLHPGMKGKVKVKAAKARIPSAKADAAAVAKQIAADEKKAKAIADTKVPANTVQLGAADKEVEYFGMLPATLTVPVGTTVEFRMGAKSREAHTATFGPGNPDKEPASYLGTIAKTFEGPGPFDGRATYPSDPPTGIATLTPTLHGNGFWSSGGLDAVAASQPPSASKVTFGQAGTYTFYCLIHTFMKGEVVVQ